MNYIKINRNGYGSNFNNLYINNNYTLIKKEAINYYGNIKIKNEINFYNFIIKNKINFNIPEIIENNENFYIMNYIQKDSDSKIDYNLIIEELKKLYKYSKIIDKEYYNKILKEETIIKVRKRLDEIKNFIQIEEELLNKIEKKINNYILNNNNFEISLIHGDPQQNNIIKSNNIIYFIDPKGIFGSSNLYGIKEYDIAKIYFSYSGYDILDELQIINDIDIMKIIKIPKFKFHNENDFNNDLILIFFLTIWLSNSHIFKNDLLKMKYSYKIALYFCSIFI